MKIVTLYRSPNHGARPLSAEVNCVVMHATADKHTMASVEWCCTPAPRNPNPVSYHEIVDRDGTVYALVDISRRAWHAGKSSFLGDADVNDFSIGISLANDNAGEVYPEVQLRNAAILVAGHIKKHPAITLERITMHKTIAPTRKTDPAPPFDLAQFREMVREELEAAGVSLAKNPAIAPSPRSAETRQG